MGITGPVDGPPSRVGVPIIDITSGMFAATAILAALFDRNQSGKGQHIDISLLDTQVALLTNVASNYLISGDPPQRQGNAHPNITPYEAFQARDKGFMLGAARYDGDAFQIRQFFLRDPVEEPAQLAALHDYLSSCTALGATWRFAARSVVWSPNRAPGRVSCGRPCASAADWVAASPGAARSGSCLSRPAQLHWPGQP